MTGVQLHLVLNHLPVFGILFGFVVLALGLWRRNESWTRLSLGMLVVVGIAAAFVMMTGESAEEAVEHLPGVSESIIHEHEEAAELTALITYALGAGALVALWVFRRRAMPRAVSVVALVLTMGASGLVAYTAHLGGQIRHTEIRSASVATENQEEGEERERDIEH
jgi:uncharacterized membrane protein